MRTIGLLGGMSWESTVEYYRLINQDVGIRLGGLRSAKIVLYSVDFHEIEQLQHAGQWDQAAALLCTAARAVERAGAQCLAICTNTMHKLANEIAGAIAIPLIHIGDATALAIRRQGISHVGLLGTKFTMEQDFYKRRLLEHGITVATPADPERDSVHSIIYDELCRGIISPASRARYREIISNLVDAGVAGIVMGCTEIPLLVRPEDCRVPLFNTTQIHAQAVVDWALEHE
jgi:aspartate racemase